MLVDIIFRRVNMHDAINDFFKNYLLINRPTFESSVWDSS